MTPGLTDRDRALLAGEAGDASRLAMRMIVEMGRVVGAERLVDVTSAHVDGCLWHGQAGLDWAERLRDGGAHVAVPTTLNVSSLDLLHPELYRGDETTRASARHLMELYVAMGCTPTWTCAPYQLARRPSFGEQIAWAESNAIVFANSVLGARTERYGDFIDICAAITGRVPYAGLHRTEGRRGEVVFDVGRLPPDLLEQDAFFPVIGHVVGAAAGPRIPVVDGLAAATEDQLKALGAAAASSGAVAMFHATGITPEAATLRDALQGRAPIETIEVTPAMLRDARNSLSTSHDAGITGVSLGTPHFSVAEFADLVTMVSDVHIHPAMEFYVSTSRFVLEEIDRRGWAELLRDAGITIVVDTCTYITPIIKKTEGRMMTNSAKWAYYAPGNIGVDVVFGSTKECVRSAQQGRVWRDDGLWGV